MSAPLGTKFYISGFGGITWREPGEERYALPKGSRPLVVIDPEDREQVKRVIRAFWANGNDAGDDTRAMQAALRSLVASPHCDASITIGGVLIECERDDANHPTDHRNDSMGQGIRWSE